MCNCVLFQSGACKPRHMRRRLAAAAATARWASICGRPARLMLLHPFRANAAALILSRPTLIVQPERVPPSGGTLVKRSAAGIEAQQPNSSPAGRRARPEHQTSRRCRRRRRPIRRYRAAMSLAGRAFTAYTQQLQRRPWRTQMVTTGVLW